jgi:cytoskeletal protein RodZ
VNYDFKKIGKRLKDTRLSLNKELKDLVEEIKISEEYLEAIESGDTDGLPSMIYYNLFVRTYARELNLDPESVFYDAITDEPFAEDRTASTSKEPKESHEHEKQEEPSGYTSTGKIILWLVGIVIVAFAAVIVITTMREDSDSVEGNQSQEMVTHSDNLTEAHNLLGQFSDSAGTGDSAEIDSVIQEREPEIFPMKLEIMVNESCWLLVLADNDTVLHRTLPPGASRSLSADEGFNISIGNPNGIVMTLDDKPVRSLSRAGRPISNILITQQNKESYILTQDINEIGEAQGEGN